MTEVEPERSCGSLFWRGARVRPAQELLYSVPWSWAWGKLPPCLCRRTDRHCTRPRRQARARYGAGVLQILANQIEQIAAAITALETAPGLAEEPSASGWPAFRGLGRHRDSHSHNGSGPECLS